MEWDDERLEALEYAIPGACAVCRAESGGLILLAGSGKLARLVGRTEEELSALRGKDAAALIREEDRPRILAELRKLTEDGQEAQLAFRAADGEYKDAQLCADVRRIGRQAGEPIVLAILRSSEEELKKQLKRSRALCDAVVQAAQVSLWEYDIPQRRIRILSVKASSRAAEFVREHPVIDNIPAALHQLLDEDGEQSCMEVYRAIDKGAATASCEYWYRREPNESPYCERMTYTTVFGEDGRPLRAYGTGQNITAQKLEEEKYNGLYRQMAKVNPSAIGTFRLNLTKDTCGGGESSSPVILRLQKSGTVDGYFEASAALITDEALRQRFRERFTRAKLLQAFRNGQTEHSLQYPVENNDGDVIWIEGFLSMAQNPASGDVVAVAYALDVTEGQIEKNIANRIALEKYDYIGLVRPAKHTFELRKKNASFLPFFIGQQADYGGIGQRMLRYVVPGDRELFRRETALEHVTAALYEKGSCGFLYRALDANRSTRRKRVRFAWLDSTKTAILMTQSDVTEVFEQEQEQLRREQSAQRAAEQLRSLGTTLNRIPAGLAVYRRKNGRTEIVMVNDVLCTLVQTPRERIMCGDYDQIVREGTHPDDLENVRASMDRLFAGESGETFDYRTRLADGAGYLWVSATGRCVKEQDGGRLAYVLYRDATEQKRQEEEYDRKIREVSAVNPNTLGIFHLNLTKNLLLQAQVPQHGFEPFHDAETADALLQRLEQTAYPGTDGAQSAETASCAALLAAYHRGAGNLTREFRYLNSETAELRWVTVYFTITKNPRTGDVEAVACALDTHEALLMREIMSRITGEDYDFVAVLDTQRRTIRFLSVRGEAADTVPNVTENYDEDIRYAVSRYLSGEERRENIRAMSLDTIVSELQANKAYIYPVLLPMPDGSVLRKQFKYVWLDDTRRTVLATRVDITAAYRQEQEQLERMQSALRAAEEANRAKTEFLSRISHDIRTPISIISSMTAFAREDLGDPEKLRNDLQKIETSNRFLLSLISDVLDISKIDSGKIGLSPEPYSCGEYIRSIRNILEPLCQAKGLQAAVETRLEVPVIVADKVRLNQITFNLLSNAVKYTPAGGRVTFRADCAPRGEGQALLRIDVEDTGIGMSEAFQKQMFEPFSQEFDNPGRPKAETGTGLGLSIVRRIAELMGGTVRVKSARGLGTQITLEFLLPAAAGAAPAGPENGKMPWLTAPLAGRVLLAEDNDMNAEIARRLLGAFGLESDRAENGRRAAELLAASAPGTYRAVLMDIQMPVLNGYEAAAEIRASRRPDLARIPIVAMTADAFTEAQERCRAVGMNGYITKPLEPARLYGALKAALESGRL